MVMPWVEQLGAELSGARSLEEAARQFTDTTFREVGVTASNFVPLFAGADPASETWFVCEDLSLDEGRATVMAAVATADSDLGPIAALFTNRTTVDLNETIGSRVLERTALYNDCWRPRRAEREVMAWMGTPDSPLGFLAWCRSIHERPFTPSDLRALDQARAYMERTFARLAEERRGWFGLDAVAHALRVGLPTPCGIFDELGRVIWLNDAAEREMGLRPTRTRTGLLLPTWRPELAPWADAVRTAVRASEEPGPCPGSRFPVRRIDRPNLPSLYLVVADQTPAAALRQLSPRERQVAELAALGYSAINIGSRLGIAEGTARNHLKHIYRKLGVFNRAELARWVWGKAGGAR